MKFLTSIDLLQNELQNAVLQPLAASPVSAKEGQFYYNSTDKLIYRYDGTAWAPVGVVYSQDSNTGAVITGLDSSGNVTTTNVIGLMLTGYTPVEGGYVSANMTMQQAFAAMDEAIKNAVAGGGEVNQNAWSNILIKAQSTATIAVAGASADVTLQATAKTDTFTMATGNKWFNVNGADKTINIGHALSGVAAGSVGGGTHIPKLTVDEAGHVTGMENIEVDIADYTVVKLTQAEDGYIASYQLQKDGAGVGAVINIPKDYLVKSAEIKTSTGAGDPSGFPAGTKYIDFTINTYDTEAGSGTESHIYLNVQDLVGINKITLNGEDNDNPSFYAPIDSGTVGQYLVSGGAGVAPAWTNLPTILKKYSAQNGALTAAGGAFTWTIVAATHGISDPASVQLFESATGAMVMADITTSATGVTVVINDTTGAGTLAANTYRVVIIG